MKIFSPKRNISFMISLVFYSALAIFTAPLWGTSAISPSSCAPACQSKLPETRAEEERRALRDHDEGLVDPLAIPSFPAWPPVCETRERVLFIPEVIGSTLENQWAIQLADMNVFNQSGVLQSAFGPFDPAVQSTASNVWQEDIQKIGLKTHENGRKTKVDLSLSQLSTLGTQYALGAELNHQIDRVKAPTERALSEGRLFFTIDQPLLRNFLYSSQTTNLVAQSLQLKAAQWELIQTMAKSVNTSVEGYWNLLFSEKFYQIRSEKRTRLRRIAEGSKQLIEGGQMAKMQLDQQFAEIFQENSAVVGAKQDVYSAYNDLLFAMGESPCCIGPEPPKLTLEEFPDIPPDHKIWDFDFLVSLANRYRGDLQAARLQIETNRVQLLSAQNALLPELDVVVGATVKNNAVGETGKKFFGAVGAGGPESNLLAEMSFSYPIGNDAARGRWKQAQAAVSQSVIAEAELFAEIRNEISTALRNHYTIIEEIYYAQQTVKWFEEATEAEMSRVIEGRGTIFVLLDFQGRLSNAQVDLARSLRNYAINLANLMFLCGVLIEPSEDLKSARIADVRSVYCFLEKRGVCP